MTITCRLLDMEGTNIRKVHYVSKFFHVLCDNLTIVSGIYLHKTARKSLLFQTAEELASRNPSLRHRSPQYRHAKYFASSLFLYEEHNVDTHHLAWSCCYRYVKNLIQIFLLYNIMNNMIRKLTFNQHGES